MFSFRLTFKILFSVGATICIMLLTDQYTSITMRHITSGSNTFWTKFVDWIFIFLVVPTHNICRSVCTMYKKIITLIYWWFLQVDLHKRRKNEVILTVDAYRQAFEEQLQTNKALFSKLTSLAVPSINKVERAKAIFRFLLETLNDGI